MQQPRVIEAIGLAGRNNLRRLAPDGRDVRDLAGDLLGRALPVECAELDAPILAAGWRFMHESRGLRFAHRRQMPQRCCRDGPDGLSVSAFARRVGRTLGWRALRCRRGR